jgi:hypothetical protein
MAYETPAKSSGEPDDFLTEARKRWDEGYAKEQENIEQAYDDLAFRAGDQWPTDARRLRELDGNRPCLTVNLLPQFIRQVTGDIRMMRPAINVMPIDDEADEELAEDIAGLIRYIENQGDAQAAYYNAADSAVTCGIGAIRVDRDYVSPRTFNQEIRIRGVEDAVSIIWDPNSVELTREDANWCFVPVDMSWSAFKAKYPDATVTDFKTIDLQVGEGWYSTDTVRVAEYWCKKQEQAELAMAPDGSVIEVEKADPETLARIQAEGWRREKRSINRIYRSVISGQEVLEKEQKQVGRYIPIIPFIGEEVKIGRKVVRHGVVRFAKDPQRIFNYMHSQQAEVAALQPKAPWLGTEDMFKNHLDFWETANTTNHPYLPYTPDPKAAGAAPSRIAPPVASPALAELTERSAQNIKAVIGIYDAQLGNRSNETSGVAIRARQMEGDTGTYVYKDNFARMLKHAFRVILDMIPEVYDTARTLRILGEDGKQKKIEINQVSQAPVMDDMEAAPIKDLTRGSYDVTVTMGPAHSTKAQEAADGIQAFMQAAPQAAPLILDLFAKQQEWPMAKEIAERLEPMLPPEIRARVEAKKQGVPDEQVGQFLQEQQANQPPDPQQQMAMQAAEIELATKDANRRKAVADADKAEAELAKLLVTPIEQPGNPDQGQVAPAQQQPQEPMQVMQSQGDPRVEELAAMFQQMAGQVEELTNVVREIAPPIMEELAAREMQQPQEDMPVQ